MESFWDLRYSEPGYAYGRDPNEFFRDILDTLTPGRLFLPGEGEGRNAIYAAAKGWDVTASDQSRVAMNKAMKWAAAEGLNLDYRKMDLTELECQEPLYDLVAIIYLHVPASIRPLIHRKLFSCLRPGGNLILECFHKDQLEYGTGGPPLAEMLYSEQELREDFKELDISLCENRVMEIRQGKYHNGKSSVIRLMATKK
jgi:SAM-dependent methyltransferase